MKKLLLLWALILPFVFCSCSDDKDEPDGSNIEGTWIMKNFDVGCDFTVTFSNGKALMHWSDDDDTFVATYVATEDKIYFRDEYDEWICDYAIKNGILTVRGNMWGEEDDYQLFVFTRK